ncbi:hypothetical protein [Microbacterium sp. KR10-403]|uniref:hypothetical protein n=1 Tax=Microbacterium sp. KR10-403 TaxID=3158581 RepID=UPI0032E49625
MTNTNTKKKGLAFGLTAVLVAGGLALGGTFANLVQTITDPNTHTVATKSLDFRLSSGPVTAVNLSPSSDYRPGESNQVMTNIINSGQLPAHTAFRPVLSEGAETLAAHPVLNDAVVSLKIDNGLAWRGTLGKFLSSAFVSANPIAENGWATVVYEIQTPMNVDPVEWEAWRTTKLDVKFSNDVAISQVVKGDSPLLSYAKSNGEKITQLAADAPQLPWPNGTMNSTDGAGYIIPASSLEAVVGLS